jgi:chromosomal replication initiation ATPase DnaA
MSEVMITPSVRDVEVNIPARMTMFNSGEVSEGNLSKMIDPLACSEIARLEEEVSELKRKVYELTALRIELETYKKVTENLAMELGVLHKAMPFRGTPAETQKAIKFAASLFRVPMEKLMSKDRTPEVAHARMACMYVCRVSLGMGLKPIGQMFKRDHGTALHAFRRIASMMKSSDGFKKKIEQLQDAVVGIEENVGNQNKPTNKGNK